VLAEQFLKRKKGRKRNALSTRNPLFPSFLSEMRGGGRAHESAAQRPVKRKKEKLLGKERTSSRMNTMLMLYRVTARKR